jgi:hypothetical protein
MGDQWVAQAAALRLSPAEEGQNEQGAATKAGWGDKGLALASGNHCHVMTVTDHAHSCAKRHGQSAPQYVVQGRLIIECEFGT